MLPEDFDDVICKAEAALEEICSSQERPVGLAKAELDLLSHLEEARDAMNVLWSDSDRTVLLAFFGSCLTTEDPSGEPSRISRLRAVLDSVKLSDMNAEDQRLESCRSACDSVEQVLRDLRPGSSLRMRQAELVADKVAGPDENSEKETQLQALCPNSPEISFAPPTRRAQPLSVEPPALPFTPSAASRAGGGGQEPAESLSTGDSQEVMRHVVAAMLAEKEAMEQDKAGKRRQAMKSYAECRRSLAAAILCCPQDHPDDHDKLLRHRKELGARLKYLRNLHDFEKAEPIDSQIQPVELSFQVFSLSDGESSAEEPEYLESPKSEFTFAEELESLESAQSEFVVAEEPFTFAAEEQSSELVRVDTLKKKKKKKREPRKDAMGKDGEDWKMIAACAAMGASALTVGVSGALAGGLIALTGTAAASAGALAGVGGAVAGAQMATRDDAVGTAARKAGSLAVTNAEKAKQIAAAGAQKVKGTSAESVRTSLLETTSKASTLLQDFSQKSQKVSSSATSKNGNDVFQDKLAEARKSLLGAAQQVSNGWAFFMDGSAQQDLSQRRRRAASVHANASRSAARSSAAAPRRSKSKDASHTEAKPHRKVPTAKSKRLSESEFM